MLKVLQLSSASYINRPLAVTRRFRMPAVALLLAGAVACNKADTPTSPTTTTIPATTAAEPTVTEEFTGRIGVGGSSFYSFTVEQNGTVTLTLAGVSGANVPSTVWLGLGLGTPAAEECSTTTSLNTQAGSTPQVSGTYAPGIYCARVYDIGNLIAPANFTVAIAHP